MHISLPLFGLEEERELYMYNWHVRCASYSDLCGELLLDPRIFEDGCSTGDRDRQGRRARSVLSMVTTPILKGCYGKFWV